MIEAYVYASCTSCRKTEDILKNSGADYKSRDFFRERFTRDELASVLSKAGLKPSEVLSRRSKVYKARGAEIDSLSEDQLLALMLEEPTLLRRPLVIGDQSTIVGHNPKLLDELVAGSR